MIVKNNVAGTVINELHFSLKKTHTNIYINIYHSISSQGKGNFIQNVL